MHPLYQTFHDSCKTFITEEEYLTLRDTYGKKLGEKKCREEVEKCVKFWNEKKLPITYVMLYNWLSRRE